MLLCKVLQGSASEVGAILAGKWGVKHTGAELDAMSEVAKSAQNRYVRERACVQLRLAERFSYVWTFAWIRCFVERSWRRECEKYLSVDRGRKRVFSR